MKRNERNQNIIRPQNRETINDDSNNSADISFDFCDENIYDSCNGPFDFFGHAQLSNTNLETQFRSNIGK